jgi:hypothetical protein
LVTRDDDLLPFYMGLCSRVLLSCNCHRMYHILDVLFTAEKMRISPGNRKIGAIPNISFPPGESCRPNAPCAKKCYAMKAHRLYATARKAWLDNLNEYKERPDAFFDQILVFLTENMPARFRWFVAGDIPDVEFFDRTKVICRKTPTTNHLLFTKRYDLDLDISDVPQNLKLFLSEWPGLTIPAKYSGIRIAHYETPIGHECKGKCPGCWFCFDQAEGDVYFHSH